LQCFMLTKLTSSRAKYTYETTCFYKLSSFWNLVKQIISFC
jgi:hypothetical protein